MSKANKNKQKSTFRRQKTKIRKIEPEDNCKNLDMISRKSNSNEFKGQKSEFEKFKVRGRNLDII